MNIEIVATISALVDAHQIPQIAAVVIARLAARLLVDASGAYRALLALADRGAPLAAAAERGEGGAEAQLAHCLIAEHAILAYLARTVAEAEAHMDDARARAGALAA